jgi:hypothetical protein
MPVVIEELQADVSAPPPPPAATAPAASDAGGDERKVLETIALESWALRRLMAD